MVFTRMYVSLILFCHCVCFGLIGEEIEFTTPAGENFILEVNAHETFLQVADKIQEFATNKGDHFVFEVAMRKKRSYQEIDENFWQYQEASYGSSNQAREYNRELTSAEKNDIRYIITTLANKSLATIFSNRSSIENAGSRISQVHPLRFLLYVFSDEELKVGIHNIRNKRWIWKDFSSGIKESLTDEANYQNMKDEYVSHLSGQLSIKEDLIRPAIAFRQWDELFDILIAVIPRKGDPRRYDN